MDRHDFIGLRVARWRDIAGLTQQQLADAVGVSREYISMIENGRRAVTTRSLLYRLAGALQVSITDLTAQPVQPRTPAERTAQAAVPAIRRALDREGQVAPRSVAELTNMASTAMSARMASDFGWATLGEVLPDLLTETATATDDRAVALHVQACVIGALALKPLGHVDLARVLADRAAVHAGRLGEPVHVAATAFAKSQIMLSVGSRPEALRLAERAADTVQPAATTRDDVDGDAARTWAGMLHLQAALCSASVGQPDLAAGHLDEAAELAPTVSGDPWNMEFSPANVALWRVGVALENGEPDRAPDYARRVDQAGLRTVDRRVRLHIDTARGWYAADRHDRAVRALLLAEEVAPASVHIRPAVREMVGQLARDARQRGGSDELRELAGRMGIDPLTPPEDDPTQAHHPAD